MNGLTGPLVALGSAALFGASTPLAKLLLADIDSWLLAGLLYAAAGIGLGCIVVLRKLMGGRAWSEARLRGRQWGSLAAAIMVGGVLAPVLLMWGLRITPAAGAALLLNLEGMLTGLLAWLVFKESLGRRIVLGMAAITAGALVLSWQGSSSLGGLLGPMAVAGACLGWAIDNNLTRTIALSDPVQIALLKGCSAGTVNILIALGAGAPWPVPSALGGAALVGLMGYGVSLVLFVIALRKLGTARTAAYFSLAPFFGAAVAVLVLGEPITVQLLIAGGCMAIGAWLHVSERHEHEHPHDPVVHEHRHSHDEHHRHDHGATDPDGEPHSHAHAHAWARHRHHHFPDSHHRHDH
jgi:drug/metabolite transporter (DMT)-like permease